MLKQNEIEAILNYGREANEDIQTIIRQGHEALAEYGIKVGALVMRPKSNYYPEATYKIYKISDTPSEYSGFYLYGQKLRRDGTFGTHVHSMGAAHEFHPVKKRK